MLRLTDWVHLGLRARLRAGDWAVDATLGNGHDAELLLACVGEEGRVFGFDVQAEALATTRARLGTPPGLELHEADHARLAEVLPPAARGRLAAVVFNLGYLPGGDHGRTTRATSTLAALASGLAWLGPGGVLVCTTYPTPGAEGEDGQAEARAVAAWFEREGAAAGRLTCLEPRGTRGAAPRALWLERTRSG